MVDPRIQMIGEVALEQVISTHELRRRSARAPDHAAEVGAMVRLARVMADSPLQILQTLTDEAMQLCRAGSAGISIMEAQGDNEIFRWHALSGILSSHLWGTTPRKFSPCGTVVDRNTVLLMSHMARHFLYFADLQPEVVEVLLTPFRVHGETIGTVWVVMHDENRQFDAEDARLLDNLGEFAGAAYHLCSALQSSREFDRRKDEFVAMVAHELRNPLAAVQAATQYVHVRVQALQEPELTRMTDLGQRQLKSMARMIDDLLDMVRVRLDKLELRKERVALSVLVGQVTESCRLMLEAAQHSLQVFTGEDALWVDGDPMRLHQILSNLLNNAAKYTAAGGRIELRVEQVDEKVIISVRDNGIGLSSTMLPRIFDLYSQDNLSRERAQGGLGIGLTLVRRLVELHGGSVAVKSEGLGLGSEFTVTLPLSIDPGAISPSANDASTDIRVPRSLRILVVDDNRDSADSIGLLLSMDGHTVKTAYSGAAALELARSFFPEVVLQDVSMPDMDGYTVARELRKRSETSAMTLIAMTGFTSSEDERAATSAGFNHHLGKPVDLDALQRLLGSLA